VSVRKIATSLISSGNLCKCFSARRRWLLAADSCYRLILLGLKSALEKDRNEKSVLWSDV